MCFFRKKKNKDKTKQLKMADQIMMEQVTTSEDAHILYLSDQLMKGTPLILNFEQLDVDAANKVISFISGIVYAQSGHIFEINTKTFLFGPPQLYEDNSINEFLNNL